MNVEGLSVTVDYYQFKFEDKVVNGPLSATLQTELDIVRSGYG